MPKLIHSTNMESKKGTRDIEVIEHSPSLVLGWVPPKQIWKQGFEWPFRKCCRGKLIGWQGSRKGGEQARVSSQVPLNSEVPKCLWLSPIARGLWEESGVHSECLHKGGQECSIETCYSHLLSLVKGNPQIVDLGVEVKESTSYSLTRTLLPRVLK